MSILHRFALIALIALCLAAGVPARAGPLVIAPTTIQFEAARHSAVVEVSNPSPDAVDLQFRAFSWAQADGREILEPAGDLMISPAIARVPPHGKQIFRILDAGAHDAGTERSYRLKLNELPRPSAQAIAINVEFSLPVFITPADATARLSASVRGGVVELANRGNRRIRIATLSMRDADGKMHALADGHSAYLLAGVTRRLAVPERARIGAGAMLTGASDIGTIDEPLSVLAAR